MPNQNTYHVYVLKSLKSGKYYVGMATNVELRLSQHNQCRSAFTKGHVPWILVNSENIGSVVDARKREKYLKSAAGKRYLKKIGVITV